MCAGMGVCVYTGGCVQGWSCRCVCRGEPWLVRVCAGLGPVGTRYEVCVQLGGSWVYVCVCVCVRARVGSGWAVCASDWTWTCEFLFVQLICSFLRRLLLRTFVVISYFELSDVCGSRALFAAMTCRLVSKCCRLVPLKEVVATEVETTQEVVTSQLENAEVPHEETMVMTSSGEIMTQAQYTALTTLADMTSHEETVTSRRPQEEEEMEPLAAEQVQFMSCALVLPTGHVDW